MGTLVTVPLMRAIGDAIVTAKIAVRFFYEERLNAF